MNQVWSFDTSFIPDVDHLVVHQPMVLNCVYIESDHICVHGRWHIARDQQECKLTATSCTYCGPQLMDTSSSASIFVLSLLCLQAAAEAGPAYYDDLPIPQVFTIGSSSGIESRASKPDYVAHPAGDLVCRPFGQCEPCPIDEVSFPCAFTSATTIASSSRN